MLATGLSPLLSQALEEVVRAVPCLMHTVQLALLEQCIMTLHTLDPIEIQLAPPEERHLAGAPSTVEQQQAALECIASFDWNGQQLVRLVHSTVLPIVEEGASLSLRLAATAAVCHAAVPPYGALKRGWVVTLVSEILDRLVAVAVSSCYPALRIAILQSLDSRFDRLLCQPSHLRALFMIFSDDVYEVCGMCLLTD